MDEEQFAAYTNLNELHLYNTKRLGEYQHLSSAIKINTSISAYSQQYQAFTESFAIGTHIRASFHELVHSFQYHTTPFGMYLSLLSEFQMEQIRQIIMNMREWMPVTYPLLPYIRKYFQPVQKYPKVWFHLKYWYLAELVRLYFYGDFENFNYYYQNSIFRESMPSDWFYELEREMCRVLGFAPINRQKPEREKEAKYLVMDLGLRMISGTDASSVFENQARVSEYWWETGYRKNPFTTVSHQPHYSALIADYASTTNAENFQQFTETFYAVCELALYSPILPICRKEEYSLSIRQLNPIVRVQEIMKAAQTVAPIRDFDDHRRFLDEVSEKLLYPPLSILLQEGQQFCQRPRGSYDSCCFLVSQRLRQQNFSMFYNLGLWHPMSKATYADAPTFTNFFIPPIVQFSDKTLFFKEAKVVQGLFDRHLSYYYLKELLIGFQRDTTRKNEVQVISPYRTSGKDLERMQNFCLERLQSALGKDIPSAKVI